MTVPPLSSPRPRGWRSPILVCIAVGLVAGTCGCWISYGLHAGLGELGVLLGSEPIEDVLAEGDLDEDTRAKLEYVLDVRAYAVDVLGLNGGDSYTTFYDSHGQDVLYNVSACRKDELVARVWSFPIVGDFEYLGFFDEDKARARVERLEANGWDVFLYPPDGYSTVGWFVDPLFSAALYRDAIDLADLVIHELTHNTVFVSGDSVFNESLATFVGRTGAKNYLTGRFGADSDIVAIIAERWADTDLYNQFWIELYLALEAFYAREDLTSEQKIAQREDIFAEFKQRFEDEWLPAMNDPHRYGGVPYAEFDNALVMIQRRYNLDIELFQAVYDELGQDLAAAIRIFAASAGAPDPKQYLRDWVAARQ